MERVHLRSPNGQPEKPRSVQLGGTTRVLSDALLSWSAGSHGSLIEVEASLGAPSTKIRNAIERLGVRNDKGLRTLENVVQESGRLTESLFDQIASERRIFLTQLASTDPRKAIKQAWEMVREAAIDVAGRRGISWTSTKDFTELLSREGQLSGPVVKLILDLRTLRYEMADQEDQEIRSTTATAYVAAAANVVDMLRTLPRGPRVDQ